MRKNTTMMLVAAASAVLLSGCASIEDVKRAQSTADQALALAGEGKAAAQQAQGTADQAVAAAQRAQSTADQGVTAAQVADGKGQAAGDAAAKNEKVFWQHHQTHHRHRKAK
jgi:uncharacterized protein YceK